MPCPSQALPKKATKAPLCSRTAQHIHTAHPTALGLGMGRSGWLYWHSPSVRAGSALGFTGAPSTELLLARFHPEPGPGFRSVSKASGVLIESCDLPAQPQKCWQLPGHELGSCGAGRVAPGSGFGGVWSSHPSRRDRHRGCWLACGRAAGWRRARGSGGTRDLGDGAEQQARDGAPRAPGTEHDAGGAQPRLFGGGRAGKKNWFWHNAAPRSSFWASALGLFVSEHPARGWVLSWPCSHIKCEL